MDMLYAMFHSFAGFTEMTDNVRHGYELHLLAIIHTLEEAMRDE